MFLAHPLLPVNTSVIIMGNEMRGKCPVCSTEFEFATLPARCPGCKTLLTDPQQASQVYALHRAELLALPYVVSAYATDDEIVLLLSQEPPPGVIPESIEGVRIRKRVTGRIIPRTLMQVETRARTDRIRPLVGGISVGPVNGPTGTLAWVVEHNTDAYLVSNSHVLSYYGAIDIGREVTQPGSYNGGSEADIVGNLFGYIPVVERDNLVDLALSKLTTGEYLVGELYELGAMKGIGSVAPDALVRKEGRTTGVTEGPVLATDADVVVTLNEERYIFTGQILAEMHSGPGDSGSPVLDVDNNLVGLLFAGTEDGTISVANKIDHVLEGIKQIIAGVPPPPPNLAALTVLGFILSLISFGIVLARRKK